MQLIFPAAMELVSTRRWEGHHGNAISAILLILPAIGKTKRQFKSQTELFIGPLITI